MQRYILITGASSGIGWATAAKLAEQKKNLILIARRGGRLEKLAKQLKKHGVEILVKTLDVTDAKALKKVFKECEKVSLDAVINNAGLALGRDPLGAADPHDLQTMIDVNISAFLHVARLSLPHLKKAKGHLINLGSIAGLEVYEGGSTYCASKHFVHALSKGIRQDTLGTGMRVTEIAPGAVETEFSQVRFKGDTQKAKKVYQGYQPLKPEDIADAIWYALSRPAHVNIQHMLVMPTAQASATKIAIKS